MNNIHAKTVTQTDPRAFHILLVEDDVEMRRLLSWTLRHHGFAVVEAWDGNELSRLVGNACTRGSLDGIDLIISDIRMPGATGLDALEASVDLPPVILITAFPDEETEARARRLGAYSLLAKPFMLEDLVEKVDQVALQPFAVGTKQRLPLESADRRVAFPIEIAFRGRCETGPIEAFIKTAAAKLNYQATTISRCRVVVHQLESSDRKSHRYDVHIELTVQGRKISVRHTPDRGMQDPYVAIRAAFAIARRRIDDDHRKRGRKRCYDEPAPDPDTALL